MARFISGIEEGIIYVGEINNKHIQRLRSASRNWDKPGMSSVYFNF